MKAVRHRRSVVRPRPRQGASRVARAFLVYVLSPLPRHSHWRHCLAHPARDISLPRKGRLVGLCIVLLEAYSAFRSRYGPHTRAATNSWPAYPKASDISSPPCLLRLLPAGALAGRGLHPLESAAFSQRTPKKIPFLCSGADLDTAMNAWRARTSRPTM